MQTRLPSLRGIEAFITAADTLSFRVTAERLNISVSAVSHRIHVLEEELGLQLFDRSGRSLTLTPAGERYRDHLVPGLKALQQATDLVWTSAEGPALKIAIFPLLYSNWLVPRLGRFLALRPNTMIEVLTLGASSGRPDIVLGPASGAGMKQRLQEGCHKLFDWDLTPVCHPDLVRKHGLKKPGDLAGVLLIEMSAALDAWPRWFERAGHSRQFPRKSFLMDSLVPAHDAVFAGLGVALTATVFVPHLIKQGLVAPFDTTCRYSGGAYVSPAEGLERPVVQAFRDWVREEARATVEGLSVRGANAPLEAVPLDF